MPSAEHEALVASLGDAVLTPVELPDAAGLAAIRLAETAGRVDPPPGVIVSDLTWGGVPCVELTGQATGSEAGPTRVVVYFHGGGYLWLSPQSCLGVMLALAAQCGATCVGVDYRRAPEAPFPAALDDAVAVYRALLEVGHEPSNIIFAGDSAGGGLALAALLTVAELGLPAPTAGVVFSPWTDLTVSGESADAANDPVVNGAGLRSMAAAYLAGADPHNPHASPLFASDEALLALPPVLIQVGTREALLDDARRFATRAQAAGAVVTLVEHDQVIHMWVVMDPTLPESVDAFERAGVFVRGRPSR
jgi:epsilon-lactone hydrolase